MATGISARELRLREREERKAEQDRMLAEENQRRRTLNNSRHGRSRLEDQGVLLSEEDEPIAPPTPSAQDDSHLLSYGDDYLTLSETEEEIEAIDDGTRKSNVLQRQQSDIQSQQQEGEEEESNPQLVHERTRQLEEDRTRWEERMNELEKREQQAIERERNLKEKRRAFQRQMEEDEDKYRQEIKRRMKREMYDESLYILKKLESDLAEKQIMAREKEIEIEQREKEIELAEQMWAENKIQMQKHFQEKMRHEFEEGMTESERERINPKPEYCLDRFSDYEFPVRKMEHIKSNERHGLKPEFMESPQNRKDIKERRVYLEKDRTSYKSMPRESAMPPEIKRQKHRGTEENVEKQMPEVSSVGTHKTPFQSTELSYVPTTEYKAPEGFIMKPFIGVFSGSQPTPKHESSFEVWKFEVEGLIAAKVYPDISIVQAIRKSLRGQAKSLLVPMGPSAKSGDIVKKLESVFGNVASGEAVLQEFYTVNQEENETATGWGLRLEQILQKAINKGHVQEANKNEMLRNKFWRSLYNQNLKNATKIYHQSIDSFEELQRKVSEEEYDIKEGLMRTPVVKQKDRRAGAQHQPHMMESDDHMKMLKSLMEKMSTMEKDIQQIKREPRGRFRGRGGRRPFNRNNTDRDTTERKEVTEKDRKQEKDSLNSCLR